jgi:GxxExxY protein
VYRRALGTELRARGHCCVEEGLAEVAYKGVIVGTYRYDLLVDDRVLIETKAGEGLRPTDKRQLLNYLRATNRKVGLLLHFGPEPRFLRCVHQKFVDPA